MPDTSSSSALSLRLGEAALQNGVQNVHYFNGRLLSAEDLSDDQKAGREQRAQLGTAIGDGVVRGFTVSLTMQGQSDRFPVLGVTSGLALNRYGQTLKLADDAAVTLGTPPASGSLSAGGMFAACAEAPNQLATPTGVFVLTVSPASGFSGSAPVVSLKPAGSGTGCGSRYEVEGVKFQIVEADVNAYMDAIGVPKTDIAPLFTRTDEASLSLLRNRLAHLCFGTDELAILAASPFQRPSRPGLLEWMRERDDLTPCAVPLALLYWRQNTVFVLDEWAVRRSPAPLPHEAAFASAGGPYREAVTRALMAQFQRQILDTGAHSNPRPALKADERFRYLPPVGLLPVRNDASPNGLNADVFFGSRASQDIAMLDAERIEPLLEAARHYAPIDLTTAGRIQLYLVWEAVQKPEMLQSTLVFASGAVPYYGTARFGFAKYGYARFATRVL